MGTQGLETVDRGPQGPGESPGGVWGFAPKGRYTLQYGHDLQLTKTNAFSNLLKSKHHEWAF